MHNTVRLRGNTTQQNWLYISSLHYTNHTLAQFDLIKNNSYDQENCSSFVQFIIKSPTE